MDFVDMRTTPICVYLYHTILLKPSEYTEYCLLYKVVSGAVLCMYYTIWSISPYREYVWGPQTPRQDGIDAQPDGLIH